MPGFASNVPAEFFEKQVVWDVGFALTGDVVEVSLTFNRLLPGGDFIQFDEDPETTLDFSNDEPDALLTEAILALIPSNRLISCLTHQRERRAWSLWDRDVLKHEFAGTDRQVVAQVFQGRLWNPSGAADFIFVGGDSSAHTVDAINQAAQRANDTLMADGVQRLPTLDALLTDYERFFFTRTSEVYLLARGSRSLLAEIWGELRPIADQHNLVLPPLY